METIQQSKPQTRSSFAVNKHLRSVASVGFLFTFNIAFSRVQQPGLYKEICRSWDSNQRSIFPKARVQLPWLHNEICRQWDSNQRSLCPKATPSNH